MSVPWRPLTGLERVWLVADRAWPPFVNQLVVEGEGALDPAAWRRAVDTILPAWPGARARLRGVLGWTRWMADGEPPAVVEIDEAWDGRGPAALTVRPLDPWRGPIVEVLLVPGDTARVVLRTHHAAFDGRAAWALAEDLGAALRGEPVRGAAFAGVSDLALAGPGPYEPEPPADAGLPTGAPDGDPSVGETTSSGGGEATTWARVSLPAVPRPVLPHVLVALGRAATTFTPDPLRVSLPVDLRRHAPSSGALRAAANLTGFLRVAIDGASTVAGVDAAVRAALDARAELGPVRLAHRLRGVPLAWMESAGRAAARDVLRTGRASTSATLSNLGRMDPAVFAAPGFRPRRLFWIPPAGAGTPLFLTLTGHPEGLDLCGGMPRALASGGRLESLLAGVVAGVEHPPAHDA